MAQRTTTSSGPKLPRSLGITFASPFFALCDMLDTIVQNVFHKYTLEAHGSSTFEKNCES